MPYRRFSCLALGAFATVAAAQWVPVKVSPWIDQKFLKRINFEGQRTLGYHVQNVTGDSESFNALTNYGTGLQRFTDIGSLTVTGRSVLDAFQFDVRFQDNRFQDPQQQQYRIAYERAGNPFKLQFGTIQGSLLNTNSFASFSRSLEGTQVEYAKGRFATRALRTEARGEARTVTLEGNNSAGPYYLQAGRIIEGSIRVRVDSEDLAINRDFVADLELGTITFLSRVVAPTSTILVSYESFGFGGNRGSISGYGASYDMGKAGRIGFTSISQDAAGDGSIGLRLEQFQGYGDPSTPYFLQFEPIAGSVEIKIDGITQVQGVAGTDVGDYYFDPINPLIFYFRRFIPSTQTISVFYRPKPTRTIEGDRRVTGIDYQYNLDQSGRRFLRYEQAVGELISATPLKGTARGASFGYELGNFYLRGSVRDVPGDFVSVEQTGFNRNERASELNLQYLKGAYTGDVLYTNSVVQTVDSLTGIVRPGARVTNTRGTLTYNKTSDMAWSLIQNRSTVSGTNQNELDTTSLSASKRYGKLLTTLGVERQTGNGLVSDGTSSSVRDIGIGTLRTTLAYDAGRGWTLSGRAGTSTISVGDQSGTGRDYNLNATLNDSGPWSGTTIGYALSDSGALATLGGFINGSGTGFGGNGFSNGSNTGGTIATGAVNLRRFGVDTRYRWTDRLSFTAGYTDQETGGAITSNTTLNRRSVGMVIDFGRSHMFNIAYDTSIVDFLATGTSTDSRSLNTFYVAAPPGPWNWQFGYSLTLSSGGSFAQDASTFDFSIGHRLSARQRIDFSITSGAIRGYYPQDDFSWRASYSYQIFKNIALTGSYGFRDLRNLDPSLMGGAFRSSGLDLELTFNFNTR